MSMKSSTRFSLALAVAVALAGCAQSSSLRPTSQTAPTTADVTPATKTSLGYFGAFGPPADGPQIVTKDYPANPVTRRTRDAQAAQ
jgi:ABC-type glycerol-3-phosphate transport system substrate-binding protein